MDSLPSWRSVLVIGRVPLAIRFNKDVVNRIWCTFQYRIEVTERLLVTQLTMIWNDLIDIPIHYEFFVIDRLFTYRTRPRRCLLIYRVP